MKEAIRKVLDREDLSVEEAKRAMNFMLSGEATQAQLGSFLTGLRMKGETIDEIVGCATVLREKAEHIKPNIDTYVDLVGTGGDSTFSFNISTTSAFVVAAAGLPVAKHGNRSISSKSGAADVLEELGVNIMTEPAVVEKAVEEVGIGFMFAQTFNKSMKNVGQARKEMGVRTIFNILGPISNPSGAPCLVIGVFADYLTEPLARALLKMGAKSALVVHAEDGMDEISNASETRVSEIKEGKVITYMITPEQFGFTRTTLQELQGGTASVNAEITKSILSGEEKGPKRDVVLMNAGATLYAGGIVDTMEAGIKLAAKMIDTGKAIKKLNQLVEFTNQ